jgi:hypothetical protein
MFHISYANTIVHPPETFQTKQTKREVSSRESLTRAKG